MHGHVCSRCKLHSASSWVELSCTRYRPRSRINLLVVLHGNGYFVHTVLQLVDFGKVGSKSLNGVSVPSGKQRLIRDKQSGITPLDFFQTLAPYDCIYKEKKAFLAKCKDLPYHSRPFSDSKQIYREILMCGAIHQGRICQIFTRFYITLHPNHPSPSCHTPDAEIFLLDSFLNKEP